MRTSLWLLALTALATETACVKPVNTVPAPVAPTAQVQYYDLELPPGLGIRSGGFFRHHVLERVGSTPGRRWQHRQRARVREGVRREQDYRRAVPGFV